MNAGTGTIDGAVERVGRWTAARTTRRSFLHRLGQLAVFVAAGPTIAGLLIREAQARVCGQSGVTPKCDTFDCTGVTEDGRTIEFTATITAEDTFDIGSTNVILPSDLGQVEALTAQAIGESIGIVLPADSVDCGAEPLIVDGDATMLCAVTDPDTGDVYDTTLSNIVLAPDDISFEYDVAESPRS